MAKTTNTPYCVLLIAYGVLLATASGRGGGGIVGPAVSLVCNCLRIISITLIRKSNNNNLGLLDLLFVCVARRQSGASPRTVN